MTDFPYSSIIWLNKGFYTIVDNEDYDKLIRYKWRVKQSEYRIYAETSMWINKKSKNCTLHRLLMNPPKDMMIDHINRRPFDNRKSNLRICSASINARNTGLSKNNTSGYKGVVKKNNRYYAEISVNGKGIHLGYFATAIEAARAYDVAKVKYHANCGLNNEQLGLL